MAAVRFFQYLFTTKVNQAYFDLIFQGCTFNPIMVEDKNRLQLPYQPQEILEALKSMHPIKAPGSDGYHAKFSKHNGGQLERPSQICFWIV